MGLTGSATALDRTLKDRKTNAGDIAKVGIGVGAGALLGTAVSGGSTKGAVIGGVAGGAVGAQRAVETQDRDVVVPSGSRLKVTLTAPFRRSHLRKGSCTTSAPSARAGRSRLARCTGCYTVVCPERSSTRTRGRAMRHVSRSHRPKTLLRPGSRARPASGRRSGRHSKRRGGNRVLLG